MAKTKQIAVRLDPDTKAGIERAAAADGRSVSGLIARIVQQWLSENASWPEETPQPAPANKIADFIRRAKS